MIVFANKSGLGIFKPELSIPAEFLVEIPNLLTWRNFFRRRNCNLLNKLIVMFMVKRDLCLDRKFANHECPIKSELKLWGRQLILNPGSHIMPDSLSNFNGGG